MKKGGLAILVASKKPEGEEPEGEEGGADELEKGAEAVAKEMFAAVKDNDESTFVRSFVNYCKMLKEE